MRAAADPGRRLRAINTPCAAAPVLASPKIPWYARVAVPVGALGLRDAVRDDPPWSDGMRAALLPAAIPAAAADRFLPRRRTP